ncbi:MULTISPECIES: phosphate ABC transporter substrate-binding protein PstS [Acetobacteraceae]|uniref:phosphate ABC transporter substrate-binding protein PstS n=1 Tax=Acetobacteraceae TaxID=433 RepID=UPI000A3CFA02|nr:phosphate ABC transporter substrate-binding protein PstS [Parasaccharibacter sp. TMW 2.1891]MCL1563320.1 phosphate ABC transporter substrate-binding protein PstS [Parasaccharibacter sp. TMW 2.1886]MPV99439.1 phosphate ABC transporter substrate-binding protein PstS [Bombella apis]
MRPTDKRLLRWKNCGRAFMLVLSISSALAGVARAEDVEITGAGSSFAAPIYQSWSVPAGEQAGLQVNYQTVGSSAGQDQVVERTVDFGASDKPMSPNRLAETHLYQFPTVMSGVVLVVNLPGVPAGALRLDGPTLAALYDGRITDWDDPRIQALNPGVTLPDMGVVAVHRADGAGTTYVFTSYLSRTSPEWEARIGAGTLVEWAGGAGARGNDGIAALVRQTEGSIGYVEYAYAAQNHLGIVQMKNHDGRFVLPSLKGFIDAASAAEWKAEDHFAVNLLDQPGAESWPIVSATYVLVPEDAVDRPEGQGVKRFFSWGFAHGAEINARLGYVGLPTSVSDAVLRGWPSSAAGK